MAALGHEAASTRAQADWGGVPHRANIANDVPSCTTVSVEPSGNQRFGSRCAPQPRRCLLIGATRIARDIVQRTRDCDSSNSEVVGYVRTPHDEIDLPYLPEVCAVDQLDIAAESGNWSHVLIALPLSAAHTVADVLARLDARVATIEWILDELDCHLVCPRVSHVAGYRTIELRGKALRGPARAVKRLEDYVVSVVSLIIASPLMLALAVGVKLTSRGPVFYRQRRVGLNGKQFDMFKFRSMPLDTERSAVTWGHSNRKVATRFGRFIRRMNFDELPQLFNVLRGEMSIVGPRPERPQFVEQFRHQIPGYMQKHSVQAGITGWAQINGWRGDTDLTKRIECDLYYVNHWSLWFDLKVIFSTVFKPLPRREQQASPTTMESDAR